ncbi:MAG TPA: DMT family transporter [Gemmataceae bacterium]|nr:DMT family transporter [Gemmataceae bacterium]
MTATDPGPVRARILIAAAAVLWSLSGAFKSVLTHPTPLGLHEPPLDAAQIAFYRVLFAGLVLVPTLRRVDLGFRPAMIGMVLTFAAMNALFIRALTLGTAANAIFLQYTAPLWVYLAGIWWLGEKPDRRSTVGVAAGMAGVAVILSAGWTGERLDVIGYALGSGVAYAGVLLWLRVLRGDSPRWLTVLNHLGSALILYPDAARFGWPTPSQLAWLFLFGAVQMGLPYWLMARGLRTVNASEAAMLSLLEPILNPLWAYLVSPEQESPPMVTWVGGALILSGIACRYLPARPTIR